MADKDKFGHKMMEKMGWSSGKGLGRDLSGVTSHIGVRKKKDNSGTFSQVAPISTSCLPGGKGEEARGSENCNKKKSKETDWERHVASNFLCIVEHTHDVTRTSPIFNVTQITYWKGPPATGK